MIYTPLLLLLPRPPPHPPTPVSLPLPPTHQGINVALFWDKVDFKEYIPLVPTSAHTGDGMGDLIALLVTYSQKVLAPKLMLSQEPEAVVLEVRTPAACIHGHPHLYTCTAYSLLCVICIVEYVCRRIDHRQ